jgi:phosphatidate phosphatase APP1
MPRSFLNSDISIKIYHGYGHTHDLMLYGHVFKNKPPASPYYGKNIFINILQLLRLFFIKPLAGIEVHLKWGNQILTSITEDDGFFKFEWASENELSAGWHRVVVSVTSEGGVVTSGEGKIFSPHVTQYAFISDIDDTILISYSSTIFKRLRVLLSNNPHTRKPFDYVVEHYKLLAAGHTMDNTPNPFFYVSSSEWNLYDDLNEFFKFNGLPEGTFLLSQIKKWFQLWKTGKTKHEAKLLRVLRIIETFPKQQFILFGDNTQSDPSIYASIAKKYPNKIFAVYVRNVVSKNELIAKSFLKEIENQGVYTCFFKNSSEAIGHSKMIGLIGN